jgi:integrase/recombinase XerD
MIAPDQRRRCLPVADWPIRDREAWMAAHRHGGLLDEGGLAADWAVATSHLIARGYGRFLGFLIARDALDPEETPDRRVTLSLVEAYVEELRCLNHSSTVASRLLQLDRAVSVMAPTVDWGWLRRIKRKLQRSARPAHDDRARLVPSDDLVNLAFNLMKGAEADEKAAPWRRAVRFRDGLLIAILCAWAPRARNLAETAIGNNLQRRGETWWCCYGADEVKNHRAIEVPLPEFLNHPIERYLAQHRPLLAARSRDGASSDAAWLSFSGLPLTPKEVGRIVSTVTRRELGKAVNPHLFRKIIPTELAIQDPEHVGVAQAILGHTDYAMTQHYYNRGRAIDAARKHQVLLRTVRDGQA